MTEDAERQSLYAEAILGKDAEQFIHSTLGQTMIGMAEQDAMEATQKLKTMLPWPARRVLKVQSDIARAESFGAYLRELYVRGEQALQQLEGPE
jgi:hypothetical protein